MQANELNISAIPAFDDNYIWLLRTGEKACAVVDPGDADPVLEVVEQLGLDLSYILLTHHHYDHVGGVPALLERYEAKVFGPADERIPFVHQICREGDEIQLPDLETSIPGH